MIFLEMKEELNKDGFEIVEWTLKGKDKTQMYKIQIYDLGRDLELEVMFRKLIEKFKGQGMKFVNCNVHYNFIAMMYTFHIRVKMNEQGEE